VSDVDLAARYEAAERLLPHNWKTLVFSGSVKPNWIGGDRFWYLNKSRGGNEVVLVDPAKRTREPAFDHAELAELLSKQLGRPVEPGELPIVPDFRDGEPLRFHVEGTTFVYDPDASTLSRAGEPAPNPFEEAVSPDGRWAVVVRDHNLVLRERATGTESAITHDGIEDYSFGTMPDITTFRFILGPLGLQMPPSVLWSPDSKRFVTHRIDQRTLPSMHYVQSSPQDGGRPRLHSAHYAMVGDDAVPAAKLLVVDAESGELTWPQIPPVLIGWLPPITAQQVSWRDGATLSVFCGDRGDRTVWLYSIDAATGEARLIVEESSDTQIQTHPIFLNAPNVRLLSTGEAIWWSERTGWGHLYLYGADGSVRALTEGEWLVRELVSVDEERRTAVFTATGREPGRDLYARQLYRVGLDDGAIVQLTDDSLDHEAIGSPSGRYVVDIS